MSDTTRTADATTSSGARGAGSTPRFKARRSHAISATSPRTVACRKASTSSSTDTRSLTRDASEDRRRFRDRINELMRGGAQWSAGCYDFVRDLYLAVFELDLPDGPDLPALHAQFRRVRDGSLRLADLIVFERGGESHLYIWDGDRATHMDKDGIERWPIDFVPAPYEVYRHEALA